MSRKGERENVEWEGGVIGGVREFGEGGVWGRSERVEREGIK